MFNPFHNNNNQGHNHHGEGHNGYYDNHNNYGSNPLGHVPGMGGGYGSAHVPGTGGYGIGSAHVPGMNGGYGGSHMPTGTGFINSHGPAPVNNPVGLFKDRTHRRHKRHHDDGHSSSGSDSD